MKLDRDKVIRAREVLGYGIEKAAEEAGVSKNSVLRAEHEEDIRPLTARKIAAALDVRVADLIAEPEYPLREAPPSQQLTFNGVLEDERREAIYTSWLAFADLYADRWEKRIAAGDFDPGSINEFVRVSEDLMAVLKELNRAEVAELPPQPYSFGLPAATTGRAIYRLLGLLDPMIEAGAAMFEADALEPLRQKRIERDGALEGSGEERVAG